MLFKDIKPFARFVRRLEIDPLTALPEYIPLDARIFYVLSGEGHIRVNENEYTLPVGGLMYINAGIKYQLMPCKTVYLAVNFDFTQENCNVENPIPPINSMETDFKLLQEHAFEDAPCFNTHIFFEHFHSLAPLLTNLEDEYVKKLPFYRFEASNLLSCILTKIARRSESRPTPSSRLNIDHILTYINEHYAKDITNEVLSKEFNFHPNYISAEFKRQIGKPLHRYVLETRIYNAVSLIEAGQRNITELARLTGFSDANYFTRYFKLITGTTPARYIRTYSGVKISMTLNDR